MRFLHTADWHLGRYFHGNSLLNDQAHVLDQFIKLAAAEAVDAVVIAGDVYDRAVPPGEAVSLLGDVLERLVVHAGIPVILIAGNHDSGERIGFGGQIFERQRLYLRGALGNFSPVVLSGAHGEVAFHPLPYVEPTYARALEGGAAVTDHPSAMRHVLSMVRAGFQPGRRNVLVGHAFVAGGSESESERPLTVGGSAMVPPETFDGFDYVALGHLHRPQQAGSDRIRYSGSLLKYSFNEADHDKSVSLVEVGSEGACKVVQHRLAPLHDVRIVSGTLADLLANPGRRLSCDDYLSAHLTDPGPVLEPMARLREVYPNMMEIRFTRQEAPAGERRAGGDHRRREPADLFRAFYQDMVGSEMSDAHIDAFQECTRPLVGTDAEGGRP